MEVDMLGEKPMSFSRAERRAGTRMTLASFVSSDVLHSGYVQARGDELARRLAGCGPRLPFAPLSYLKRIDSVWVGGGAGYGLHHDIGSDQFLCQFQGRKQVLLLQDDLRGTRAARLEPLATGRFYRSKLPDAFAESRSNGGALKGVARYEDVLAPGEVLFIPCAWFHDLRPVEPSITLGFRFLMASRFLGNVFGSLGRHMAASVISRLRGENDSGV